MSYPRFIAKIENGHAVLEEQEFHHAIKVRRLKEGSKVEINDLKGNIYLGVIEKVEKKKAYVKLIEKIPVYEEKIKITLYQCVPNHLSKIDEIIEDITELGVYKFVPVISKNTAVKTKDILRKIEKWKKISVNSTKQCKRAFPVIIEQPKKLENLNPSEDLRIAFYEKEEKSIKSLKTQTSPKTIAVLIGAEGGLTEEEIKTLKEKGFETFSLGKIILRMETAVVVGICQVKFLFD